MKCLTPFLGVAGIVVCAFVHAQPTTSVKSGKWSSPSTWSNKIVPNASSGEIIINHDIDIPEDTVLVVDELIINARLTISPHSDLILENAKHAPADLLIQTGSLYVYGRLTCRDSAMIVGTTSSNTSFLDSGVYEHQYFSIAGEPPTASWAEGSTFEFTGFTTGKSLSSLKWNQSYGNVVYNCQAQRSGTFVEWLGNIQTIRGNLIIKSTGSGVLRLSLDKTALTTINIGKDFTIQDASRIWMSRNGNTTINVKRNFNFLSMVTASSYLTTQGNGVLNVDGDFVMNSPGTLRFASSGGGTGKISVRKNFDLLKGTLTLVAPGQGTIVMNGDVAQTLNLQGNVTQGVNLELANAHGVTCQSGSSSAGNILIKSFARFNLPDDIFSLQGDLSLENNADIRGSKGTLSLSGSVNQSLNLAGDTLHNIIITKSTGSLVTLTGAVNLSGVLNIGSSGVTLISNGNLTLLSMADNGEQEGSIASLPSQSFVTGDVTVQRFMSGEGRIYRYLASPVTNATVADWKNDFPVTGAFTDPSTGGGLNSSSPSLFYYDETLSENGWIHYPASGFALDNPLVPGKGYTAFIRRASLATISDVRGELNQHAISIPVTYTSTTDTLYDGWNLVGNPYASPIDWDRQAGWIKSNVSQKIAIRDNASGTFKYWDGAVGNLGSGRIAAGQAFWVQAIEHNPVLTINEAAKVNAGGIFYRDKTQPADFVHINLQGRNLSDDTFLKIDNNASMGFDPFDVVKWMNDHLNFSFLSDAVPLAIDARDKISCDQLVPLHMGFTQKMDGSLDAEFLGEYKLLLHTSGLLNENSISLFDHYLDSMVHFNNAPYSFTITKHPASFANNRFSISVSRSSTNSSLQLQFDSLICDTSPDTVTIRINNVGPGIRYECWLNDTLTQTSLGDGNDHLKIVVQKKRLTWGKNRIRISSRTACGGIATKEIILRRTSELSPPTLVESSGEIRSSHTHGTWYLDGQKISEGSSIKPLSSGWYENEIENNRCFARAGIAFTFQEDQWRFSPVPASEVLTIVSPAGTRITKVKIFSMSGSIIREFNVSGPQKEVVLEVRDVPDGIYLAEVTSDVTIGRFRFIKNSR